MSSTSNGKMPNRWLQLSLGIACTVMVANLQYAWTYFVDPINVQYHWRREAIQWGFSIFIATATWLVPLEGWFADRFGPRVVVAIGGVLVALAWIINSEATSLPSLYLGMALAGLGNGAVWGTCIANALRWFPDRRGLAAGLTAAGFGGGSALTIVPIIKVIAAFGYHAAFFWFGLAQGTALVVLSFFLFEPQRTSTPGVEAQVTTGRDHTPVEMLKSPIFWVIYAMFTTVAASGLIVTAQMAPIANDYKIANLPIDLLFVSSTVLIASAIIDNILNGLARPLFGWVSDHIGRETTMAVVFTVGAAAYWALGTLGTSPVYFMLAAGLIYFTWGEIYGLFPATCADFFGSRYAATNAGILYTGKGLAAWSVPAAGWLRTYTGNWHAVFAVATVANLAVAATAFFVLRRARDGSRPARHSFLVNSVETIET
ncbi:oxalate/formate MFS antiporter [Beijerinckia sp. L45]|uniref:oxalate/formate MFS antiporter n=1 Tax=Beijerinckia sp. L45 TaxID=1641855 RepID=UPI00131AB537|nr:oxalate/formate MFS antiporter [Beijerinckia sp. L45]